MDHTYIHQVADQLRAHGIHVSHTHIDTPETADHMGRNYARLDLTDAGPAQSLIWTDHSGWTTSTWADHYPLLGGETHPDPDRVAQEADFHINTLRSGGYLKAA